MKSVWIFGIVKLGRKDSACEGNMVMIKYIRNLHRTIERNFLIFIPAVPIINSTNSCKVFTAMLERSRQSNTEHGIFQEFILDVSPYIFDMRVLQKLYNEFLVCEGTIKTGDKQSFIATRQKTAQDGIDRLSTLIEKARSEKIHKTKELKAAFLCEITG